MSPNLHVMMNRFFRQHSTKIRQLFSAISGSAILALSLNASAEAITLQISGQYADTSSCEVYEISDDTYTGVNYSCEPTLQYVIGGATFSGTLTLTDTGEIDYVESNNEGGLGLPVLDGISLTFSGNTVTYFTSFNYFGRAYEEFYLTFLAPASGNLTEPFGSFLGGGYYTSSSTPFSVRNEYISLAFATESVVQPVPVPEPSPSVGLESIFCIGLGWLIWNRQGEQRKLLN